MRLRLGWLLCGLRFPRSTLTRIQTVRLFDTHDCDGHFDFSFATLVAAYGCGCQPPWTKSRLGWWEVRLADSARYANDARLESQTIRNLSMAPP